MSISPGIPGTAAVWTARSSRRAWAISVDADKSKDNRIITGEYKDWRKTQKNSEK